MSATVCLGVRTLRCFNAGGHFWVYLNWALGLRSLGMDVIWLEVIPTSMTVDETENLLPELKTRLAPFGLADSIRICSETLPNPKGELFDLEILDKTDLLINIAYGLPKEIVHRFRRSALLDIDPGLTQIWVNNGYFELPPHQYYFTIGETVGQPNAQFPDCGLNWIYTPPCVALDWWPVMVSNSESNYSTITQWSSEEWVGDDISGYRNDKRAGFLPYLLLPQYTTQKLELAVCLSNDAFGNREREILNHLGWRVKDAPNTLYNPQLYQKYIQSSAGEFSCCKPSCVRLQNAWVSDRTLCYLASGKPAIVQHTGPSKILPNSSGLFRFRNLDEAVKYINRVEKDYEQQCKNSRELIEEYFDATKVVKNILEIALA